MALTDKLAAIADAIRERTGGTEPLTLDQMAAEIAEIETDPVLEELTITENGEYTPGGGVDGFGRVTVDVSGGTNDTYQVFSSTQTVCFWADMPEDLHMNFLVSAALLNCKITTDQTDKPLNLICKGNVPQIGVGAFNAGNKQNVLKSLDISGKTVSCSGDETFRNCSNLVNVDAVLDFGASSMWDRTFLYCLALEEIRFLVNCVSASGVPLGNSSLLSDESIISVANSLTANTGTDSKTITLHATPKTRCDEIVGTVSSVADGEATYDFFTMDDSGTVTLTEFITTVKGWTLA